MRKLRITIEGRSYEVTVEELDGDTAAAPALPCSGESAAPTMVVRTRQPAPSPSDELVLSPIGGSIVRVEVEEGAQVGRGQPLVVIESMKMHFPVAAPHDGQVSGIRVKAADVVEEGQLLLLLRGG